MTQKNIDLIIDELVLEGFEPQETQHLSASVERELSTLVETHPQSEGVRGNAPAPSPRGHSHQTKRDAARSPSQQIARAILGAMNQ